MTRLGVITGMTREADCLSPSLTSEAPLIRVAGASAERAYSLSVALIAEGCAALVSFGTAGGLAQGLATGDLVLADHVIDADGRAYRTNAPWRQRFGDSLGDQGTVTVGPLAGSATVVASADAKLALGLATQAVAVDMESHAVGRAAEEGGVPFLVVRVIADPVSRAIPGWLLGSITEDGGTRYGAVLSGLAAHPWDLAALIGLAGNNSKAMAVLRRVAGLAGPLFRLQ